MHINSSNPIYIFLASILLLGSISAAHAQDTPSRTGGGDDSSDQVEESEEAYRRRMELEGARQQETFSNTSYSSQAKQQKIDKLPEESQQNIRAQIMDIIIENDEWEPSDVLEEYPYQPTAAAEENSELRDQELEAWAEQVDKYHEREAAAFGATRPPMPGASQQQAGTGDSGEGQQQGEQGQGKEGAGQGGSQSEKDDSRTAGSYEPYQSGSPSDDDELSTAGVSESALDFLRGKQGRLSDSGSGGGGQQIEVQNPGPGGDDPRGQAAELADGTEQQQGQEDQPANLADAGTEQQDEAEQQPSDAANQQEQAPDGSLPIEQLEQLQGVASLPTPGQQDAAAPPSGENAPSQTAAAESEANVAAQEQLAQQNEQAQQESESQEQQAPPELDLSTPGIIAIRDLEKLEGVEQPPTPDQP